MHLGRVYSIYAMNHGEASAGFEKLASVLNKYTKEFPIPGGLSVLRCVTNLAGSRRKKGGFLFLCSLWGYLFLCSL